LNQAIVALAICLRRVLESDWFAPTADLAKAERIDLAYISHVLQLTLLAPDIVEAILDGRQPEGITLPGLMEPFPVEWAAQR
jgi:hypothetical protein